MQYIGEYLKEMVKKFPPFAETLVLGSNYWPKIDLNQSYSPKMLQTIDQWMVELSRVDICFELSMV